MAQYDANNCEIPDKTPIALPIGYNAPETLADTIARMLRNQDYLKGFEGKESEEEANDFDLDDDEITISSKHEFTEMHEEYIREEHLENQEKKNPQTPPEPIPTPEPELTTP